MSESKSDFIFGLATEEIAFWTAMRHRVSAAGRSGHWVYKIAPDEEANTWGLSIIDGCAEAG